MKLTELFIAAIPHFTTDLVACYTDNEGDLIAMHSMDCHDTGNDPEPEAVVILKMMKWLGCCTFVRPHGEPFSYQTYVEAVQRVEERNQ